MNGTIRLRAGALATVLLGMGTAALAQDFAAALKDYNSGNYAAARSGFTALAELGDCTSQFNLGAMALKGQGMTQDRGSGVGWLQAALSNGCRQQVGDRVPALVASLTPAQGAAAAAVVARYGHDALQARGVVNPRFDCSEEVPAHVIDMPSPEYPAGVPVPHPEAIVIIALTIGVDGYARDPDIILSEPARGFPAAAVEAWLNTRFQPATRHGAPVASRLEAKLRFVGPTGNLADAPVYKTALPAAETGEPAAQYLIGVTANLDASLGITTAHAAQLLLNAARAGDAAAQFWVASQVRAAASCNPSGAGALWLEHAANGGSAPAAALEAQALLAATPGEAQLAQARTLLEHAAASDNYFALKHGAALLAGAAQPAVRNPAAALSAAQKLLAGEIQSDPQMFEVAAATYAASGDFRRAVTLQQTALEKARPLGWDSGAMNRRLAAYRSQQQPDESVLP